MQNTQTHRYGFYCPTQSHRSVDRGTSTNGKSQRLALALANAQISWSSDSSLYEAIDCQRESRPVPWRLAAECNHNHQAPLLSDTDYSCLLKRKKPSAYQNAEGFPNLLVRAELLAH